MVLVLLPGMIGTADLFQPLLSVIPNDINTRVIAYPPDKPLSSLQLVQFVEAELLTETDVILLGESYSGAIALAVAANHPMKIRAVILTGAFVQPPWPSWIRWFIHPLLLRWPPPSWLIRFFAAGANASEERVGWIRTAFQRPNADVMTLRAHNALTMDFSSALLNCRVPILYLAPDRDRLVRRSNLRSILKIRPDVQVQELEGPHLILQIAPKICWQIIERFAAENVA
jgi:pimeloyl-ACP methyl ester carboxylesterase